MLLSLIQIRADVLKFKKLLIEDFIGITRELRIPPLSAICAISQLRCFRKWKNSSCIINHLTNNIPTMLCHITHGLKNQGLWIRN